MYNLNVVWYICYDAQFCDQTLRRLVVLFALQLELRHVQYVGAKS